MSRPISGNVFEGIAGGAAFCQNQPLSARALMTLVLPARKSAWHKESRVHCYCGACTWYADRVDRGHA
jgi:hypothetical protein